MKYPLSKDKLISREILAEARSTASQQNRYFVSVISENYACDDYVVAPQIAAIAGIPYLSMHELDALQANFDRLSLESMLVERALFMRDEEGHNWLIVADPFHLDLIERIQTQVKVFFQLGFGLECDIHACLSKHEQNARAIERQSDSANDDVSKNFAMALSYSAIANESNQVVKFVNGTIYDALKTQASDIHLETTSNGIIVKFRIDGALDQMASEMGKAFAEQVISRLKVLAQLDIAERRVPQDGSMAIKFDAREIDLRISVMPSIHGEDIVIRILDKQSMMDHQGALRLDSLGFDQTTLDDIRQLTQLPYGMLLVTGPTGSGKTTSLYAALTEIYTQREKIITIEDPVEYQLPGILQIPVNEKKGLSFAKGLRSILRHDPDIIMVGEIRDNDTAEIAIQSALTGHLVFTTVHANSVYEVFGRFSHMGVDLYAFVSSLNGIVAQRLIRKNCPRCSKSYVPEPQEIRRAKLDAADVASYRFMKGDGCGECRGTGYKGRKAIAEVLVLNDELREMIIARKSIRLIKEEAQRQGARHLRRVALALVQSGETSLDEVNKTVLHA